ncbi:MAG: alkaline phosphatase [Bacteroidales bacterium]|nr:alkaline phosphatase [Bacteroidales bacterium]
MKRTFIWLFTLVMMLTLTSCHTDKGTVEETLPNPKNIIYFVSDGMGYNHLLATNYFMHGVAGAQVFEQDDWLHLAQATYSVGRIYRGDTIFHNGYAPRTAWEEAGYLSSDYTDSAGAATALSTGVKTLGGHLGIDVRGDTLIHISQAAKALGKSIGVVSSVPLSHATPAGFVVHNRSRHNYQEIAEYLLFHTRADVVMAPGHPYFNNDGQAVEKGSYRYIGGSELFGQLAASDGRIEFSFDDRVLRVQDATGDGIPDPWVYVEEREAFLALAEGPAPRRVLGIPQVYSSLNQGRKRSSEATTPFEQPFNENVPTLEELTRASLNVLSQNDQGFFVMIEGGAVDWASHDNHLGRTIEEQHDFNRAVLAAVAWVETHSSWEETLIIVTSDHECGYLTGPNHPNPVNDAVVNRGKGQLPEHQWNFSTHTNMLVPFFAKGPGTELFRFFADEYDPVRGYFLQNTEIAQAIFLMWGKPEIEVHRLTE